MYEYKAKVISVYDGDTMRIDIDLGFGCHLANQPVRLYGINCPELRDADGPKARSFALSKCPVGSTIVIKTTKDKKEKFGRYLGVILCEDGTNLNEALIAEGLAITYFGT